MISPLTQFTSAMWSKSSAHLCVMETLNEANIKISFKSFFKLYKEWDSLV